MYQYYYQEGLYPVNDATPRNSKQPCSTDACVVLAFIPIVEVLRIAVSLRSIDAQKLRGHKKAVWVHNLLVLASTHCSQALCHSYEFLWAKCHTGTCAKTACLEWLDLLFGMMAQLGWFLLCVGPGFQ